MATLERTQKHQKRFVNQEGSGELFTLKYFLDNVTIHLAGDRADICDNSPFHYNESQI